MSHAQILPQGAEKQLTRVNVGGWVGGGGMRANTETSRSSAGAGASTTMSIFSTEKISFWRDWEQSVSPM